MTPVVLGLRQEHLDALIRAARIGGTTPLMVISRIVIDWCDRWIAEEAVARGDEPIPPQPASR